ncbi:purple acid phosphatase 3-like [Salvia miltiorrhiza]|uniref:purple acid phosphatase 3-like n=1 Tax=Salvia miltiorrhiza TaxID=226208 RepID=UPI0025ACFCB1|nr:purple acid phosphatase 3-like [Salvia miltiorrhiza]
MSHLFYNSLLIWPLLLMTSFSLKLPSKAVELSRIQHLSKRDDHSIAFLAVGDWGRDGNFNQSRVATQMGYVGKKLGIDFVISTGDNFYTKGLKGVDDRAFQTSFTNIYTAKSLRKPWYSVLGNHDYQGNVEAQLSPALKKLDRRWNCKRNFIVEAGAADIFFVDTTPFVQKYFDNPKKQEFDWRNVFPRERYLSSTLKNLNLSLENSKARWKIVVGHHTIRSIGYHGDTQEMLDHFLPVLEAQKVDMYINGHDHCLQHLSNGRGSMQFLTSGGGSKAWKNIIHYGMHNESMHFYHDGQGFLSVEVARDNAKIAFYDVSGRPLHRLKLQKGNKKKLFT